MAGFAGTGCSFLVDAAFVDDVQSTSIPKVGNNYNLNSTQERKYQDQINVLLYVQAGVMLILFVAVLTYYPARPPKPRSYSAATGRVDFKNGLKRSSRITIFLFLALLYEASTGVYGGWYSVLDHNLSEFGLRVTQKFAGWLGFVAKISGYIIFSNFIFFVSINEIIASTMFYIPSIL